MRKILLLLLFLPAMRLSAQELDNIAKEKPFTASGNVSLGLNTYNGGGDGFIERAKPLSWLITGNVDVRFYGINLPFSFVYSEQNRDFRQPFNQFGVSPSYKWVKLHLGYRNLNFSPFTLSGITFLGAGIELTPGKLRLGAMYGRFNRAVKSDSLSNTAPAYERNGYALKLGYGSATNFVDLSLLKAADDTNSITISNAELQKSLVKPAENTAIGLTIKQTLFKKLVWDADVAVSAYTLDTRAKTIEIPEAYSAITSLYQPHLSSLFAFAAHSSLGLRLKTYTIKADYKRIDPSYKSMGAYYFQTDLQAFSLNQNLQLFQQKVNLAYNATFQNDNLLKNKTYTTGRLMNNAVVSINPNQTFGIDLLYSNFITSQTGSGTALQDSFKLDQTQHSFGITPRLTFADTNSVKNIVFAANYQLVKDENPNTALGAEMNMITMNAQFVKTIIHTQLNWSTGLLYTQLHNFYNDINNYGITAGIGRQILDRKLSLNSNAAYSISQINGYSNGSTVNFTINANYRPGQHHSLLAGILFTNYFTGANSLSAGFYELKINLNYVYAF